jgi:FkbM family methyltransferase
MKLMSEADVKAEERRRKSKRSMSSNQVPVPCGWRCDAARRILQAYPFSRGHFLLYRTLRKTLNLPRRMVIDLDANSSLRINCDLDEYIQWWIFCFGLRSDPDFEMMRSILHPNDHFVDVGANIGIFSMIASVEVGEKGAVYAVEALPENRALLERNLRLNRLWNVQVIPVALTDTDGEIDIFPSTNGNLGMTSLSPSGAKAEPIRVPARTLDSLIADGTVSGCDVLKMDIEGAEVLALRGMKEVFEQRPPRAVLIEVSESLLAHFSSTPKQVIDFFIKHGYVLRRATFKGLEPLTNLEMHGHQNIWALLPEAQNS